MQGMITDIQRCSVHDGPGLRTTLFLKGCPLRCAWCHNPECLSPKEETLYYPERCIGCNRCDEGCFAGAKVPCGRKISVEETMAQLLLDAPYYGENGGVTLSGGEPLMQPEFALTLINACREKGVGVAMETCLAVPWPKARPVLEACDLIMADLKIWPEETHRAYTGQSNRVILDNLAKIGKGNTPLILRTPVVPGINDDEADIGAIATFACGLHSLIAYDLLPYHPLGLAKAQAVAGWEAPMFDKPDQKAMRRLAEIAQTRLAVPVTIAGIPYREHLEEGHAC